MLQIAVEGANLRVLLLRGGEQGDETAKGDEAGDRDWRKEEGAEDCGFGWRHGEVVFAWLGVVCEGWRQ